MKHVQIAVDFYVCLSETSPVKEYGSPSNAIGTFKSTLNSSTATKIHLRLSFHQTVL